MKNRKFYIFAISLLFLGVSNMESVNAASSVSLYRSFNNVESNVLAGVTGTVASPYLYTSSQIYAAQFSVVAGNNEKKSTYRDTVVGGTVTITQLGSLVQYPIKLYMKNKASSALNIYQGTFFY